MKRTSRWGQYQAKDGDVARLLAQGRSAGESPGGALAEGGGLADTSTMDAQATTALPLLPVPLDEATAKALDAFLEALAAARFPFVRKVLLYGSQARGDHRPDSDADVAVAVTGDNIRIKGMDVRGATYRARGLHDERVSPLTLAEEHLDNPNASPNPAFHRNRRTARNRTVPA